jgi:hypothetical protein
MPTGLVIAIAAGMALAVPRIRLRLSVPRCKPPPREFELMVGQQLAASHHPHPLISTTR